MPSLFNLTSTMLRIGYLFTAELKNRMSRQVGVDGSRYAPLKTATVWNKLKQYPNVATKRMIRTRDFMNNAFRSDARQDNVRIFIGTEAHGRALRVTKQNLRAGKTKNIKKARQTIRALSAKEPNMNDLAVWQLDAGGAKFFPQSDKEIEGMDAYKKSMKLIEQEAYKQALNNMKLKMNVNLTVG